MLGGVTQDIELHIKQFLKLQTHLGTLYIIKTLRIVYLSV